MKIATLIIFAIAQLIIVISYLRATRIRAIKYMLLYILLLFVFFEILKIYFR